MMLGAPQCALEPQGLRDSSAGLPSTLHPGGSRTPASLRPAAPREQKADTRGHLGRGVSSAHRGPCPVPVHVGPGSSAL